MSTPINNAVQQLGLMKKEFEKSNKSIPEKQPINNETSKVDTGEYIDGSIVLEISSQGAVETKPETHEIKDAQEAQQLLSDVISDVSSENGKLQINRVHNLNPGSVIDLLA